MNEELLKSVLSDADFVKSLTELENPEDVQAALKEKGIELTLEDITAVQNILENSNGELSDELSEDDLENVAGGSLTIMAALGIAGLITAVCGGIATLGNKTDTWTSRRW